MTEPQDNALLKPPQYAQAADALPVPKHRAVSSTANYLHYARSNPSLTSLFASTSPSVSASRDSSRSTPVTSPLPGAAFPSLNSANGPRDRSPAPEPVGQTKTVILRAFAPHVGVLASEDTDAMLRQKGFNDGFLELIRPFGETVSGKVTIRDSIGASKSFDDFGVRFTGLKDLVEPVQKRRSQEQPPINRRQSQQSRPPIVDPLGRCGGNVAHIEELVDMHLNYAEMQPRSAQDAPSAGQDADAVSPFFLLYLRKLLAAQPLTPHESFSHPVACVIAISSRNPAPIEELRQLYASTNNGDNRLPPFVNNEFLRYYVLVHDEDQDDIGKSTALYEQMKRHFGLHCHLLRIRSAQCLPSDDDGIRLLSNEYQSAAEDLTEIRRRESSVDDEDPTPYLFESDATAVRTFVRELVTQSIVPSMERACATWNEQVATRRRGISGKLMSLSKRWTPFGSSNRNVSSPTGAPGSSGGNYDPLQGFYRPEAPEALMRKLGDYAFMLRDFKLAQSTYDLARSDFDSDKAWKYYAGANEMLAISALMLVPSAANPKSRIENIDRYLETAIHSYLHRALSPFYVLRALVVGSELLRLRDESTIEDAARWTARILDHGLVGPIGSILFTTRVASCHASRTGLGQLKLGSRQRKAAFWYMTAADSFSSQGKSSQAYEHLQIASRYYQSEDGSWANVHFEGMRIYLDTLQHEIKVARNERRRQIGGDDSPEEPVEEEDVEVEEVTERLGTRPHRQSLIGASVPSLDGLEAAPLSPVKFRDKGILEDPSEEFA